MATTETIQRVYELIIKAGGSKAGADEFKRASETIAAAAEKAAAAGKPLTDNALQASRAYDQLTKRIDPLVTAQNRLEKETRDVAAAFQAGVISQEQASRSIDLIGRRYDQAVARAKLMSSANLQGAAVSRNFGSAIQQAGFQVGDFAVQVASGQGVLRPLIQQGTQLISMFGPWGAVIGAAGAVLGALATSFWEVEDSEEAAEQALDAYNDAMRASEELTRALHGQNQTTVSNLEAERRRRVELAEAVLAEAQAKIQAARADVEAAAAYADTAMFSGDESVAFGGQLGLAVAERRLAQISEINKEIVSQQRQLRAENLYGGEMMDPFAALGTDFSDSYYNAADGAKKLAEETAKAKKETKELLDAVAKADAAGVAEYEKLMNELGSAVSQADAAGIAEWQRVMDEGARIMESVRTPAEAYGATIQRLNELLSLGAIDATTYFRAIAQAQQTFDNSSKSARALSEIGEQAFERVGSAVTEMALKGKDAFKDMGNFGNAILSELWQGFFRLAVMNPLKNLMNGNSDLPDLSGLIGSGIDWLFKGGVGGAIDGMMAANPAIFHAGGLVGGPAPMRPVPMAAFAGAQRFHSGGMPGLSPDEVPAILQRGEIVLPKDFGAMPARSSNVPQVVNNISFEDHSSGAKTVERRESRNSTGGTDVRLVLRDEVKRMVREGELDQPMSSRYSVNVAPRR